MCDLLTGIGSAAERLYPSERKQLLLFNVWRTDKKLLGSVGAPALCQDSGQSDARSGRLPQCFGTGYSLAWSPGMLFGASTTVSQIGLVTGRSFPQSPEAIFFG